MKAAVLRRGGRRNGERWLVLALAAALFLPCLGARDVWNPDEARYAQVAREMARAGTEDGRWMLPRLNGELYGEKPPVFFWAVQAAAWVPTGVQDVASGAVGRIDEIAVRLPSALAAAGCLWLILSLGTRLFGRRAAWIAVAAFATCFKVLWQGRFGQIDMLLTFWVTLQMDLFTCGMLASGGPTAERSRRWCYRGFFIVGAVATATKGPAGFLPPLLTVLAFLLLSGERRELKSLRLWRGLLLWAAVLLLWLVPAALAGGWGYVEHLVWHQSVTRYADPWHHHQPWWYYLAVVPVEFLPWTAFLPAAGMAAIRRLRRGATAGANRGWLLVLCWVAVTLVFFSLSAAKRSVYVLTLYPGLALWVGAALARLADVTGPRDASAAGSRWSARLVTGALVAWAMAVSGAVVAVAILGPERPELQVLGRQVLPLLLSALGILALLSWLAWGMVRKNPWSRPALARTVTSLAAGTALFWLIVACSLLPRLDATKSARLLASELASRVEAGQPWTVYPRLDAGFLFYGDLPPAHRLAGEGDAAAEVASLRRFLARPERVWLVGRRDRLGSVEDLPPLWQVAADRDLRKGYLLLTNRSHPEGHRHPQPTRR